MTIMTWRTIYYICSQTWNIAKQNVLIIPIKKKKNGTNNNSGLPRKYFTSFFLRFFHNIWFDVLNCDYRNIIFTRDHCWHHFYLTKNITTAKNKIHPNEEAQKDPTFVIVAQKGHRKHGTKIIKKIINKKQK